MRLDYEVAPQSGIPLRCDFGGVTDLYQSTGYNELEGKDVDDINVDGFDSDPGNDNETSNYRRRRLAELSREMEGVINASGHWNVRVRARCNGRVLVFTMSQGTGPTGPTHGMEARPSGSSGLNTLSKKRKNTSTNDESQACSSTSDAHDKGDLCPWVLYVGKDKHTQNWVISMSKAFRANAKAEREIRGDHVLKYSILRDYVVELQSTNPNTTINIAIERNIDPSLPTKVFKRIYVCLGVLKLGFWAYRRELFGLDGAFMKGPFPGQVLAVVGLDSNNGIYPLAYALVEAESKSSWCWFLQCMGDDINLHPNSNFTFISVRQKVGRPKKKRKRSKHEDEPFVKDGKLSKKGRTITCQSFGNIGHNKVTCKGQGCNKAEANSSAYRQAQQIEPTVGQDGSCGSGVGVVIGLSIADGACGAGVGVGSQVSTDQVTTASTNQLVLLEYFKKIAPMTEEIMGMMRKRLQKTNVVHGMVWYTNEVREHARKDC
ncbi:transposase, MuDR, MULE transposase domain protein [Tanacetum coccineum]